MAELRDITMDQGSTFNPVFILRNPDKSLFNLTGYTARMQVRQTYDSDAILSLSTTNGQLQLTPTHGRVRLNLVPADTTPLSFTGEAFEGIYDLELESPAGVVTRVAQGSFTINREVTR